MMTFFLIVAIFFCFGVCFLVGFCCGYDHAYKPLMGYSDPEGYRQRKGASDGF